MLEPSGGGAVPTRAPYYSTPAVTVHVGDCLDVLRGMPDASVDAVVTDPPYGLAKLDAATVVDAITAWAAGARARARARGRGGRRLHRSAEDRRSGRQQPPAGFTCPICGEAG